MLCSCRKLALVITFSGLMDLDRPQPKPLRVYSRRSKEEPKIKMGIAALGIKGDTSATPMIRTPVQIQLQTRG
ncbi:hypothetical protein JCGZ_24322 [Jatropha curcas]|uniref:Uncharacterized protein n=1 Tax=Jatropha curcas TaxID=180498 RepID=A0A067L5N3_JATCU|nr:hypothetical protein JCGZ_24322 [Jatropha curcas]